MTQQTMVRTTSPVGGRRDDVLVALAAAGMGAVVWVGATQAAGVDLTVGSGSGAHGVGLVSVVVTALVVAVAGGGLLRVLERRTPRGRRIWTAVAVAVWVLSFAGPLGARHASGGLVLAGLHLLVGGVVIVGLRRRHHDRVA
jgi:hypothetical protein